MKNTTWTPSGEITEHLGIIELESGDYFHIGTVGNRLVFGGMCNAGFLESGYMEMDQDADLSDSLEELLADLETFYRDGAQYVSRIVCNERM